MMNLADFVCTEQQEMEELQLTDTITTTMTSLSYSSHPDTLSIFLNQEERFIPNNYQTTKQVRNYEEQRGRILELMYEAIFPEPQPRKSDVFHLAANLLDRYLGYYPPSTEGEFRTVAMACTMISVKLRMSREEVFGPSSLQHIFYDISQNDVIETEKKVARTLKWDLNAVTTADFIEEIAERLKHLLPQDQLNEIICQSHTISNVCLLYRSFMNVPPSLLACACLCDAISYCVNSKIYQQCMDCITQLAGVEQEILIQHQKNVNEVFARKVEQTKEEENQYTPNDLEKINELEFSQKRFVYDEPHPQEAC